MPNITATLSFLANLPLYSVEKPYAIIPEAGREDISLDSLTNVETEKHEAIGITDIRDSMSTLKLDTHGFQILPHTTKYPRLDKLPQCKGYQKEMSDLLEKHFGAEHVVTWDLKKRNVIEYEKGTQWDHSDQTQTEGPAVVAHVDYTFDSGLTMVNAYLNAEDKNKYLNGKYRIRIINTWRPMVEVVEHQPLTLCSPSTVHPEQLVACDRILCDQLGEVYLLQYHESNKWYWLEHQTSSEPYLFVSWDSDSDVQARYCAHLSFHNSRASAEAPPRESVETRSIVITRKGEE